MPVQRAPGFEARREVEEQNINRECGSGGPAQSSEVLFSEAPTRDEKRFRFGKPKKLKPRAGITVRSRNGQQRAAKCGSQNEGGAALDSPCQGRQPEINGSDAEKKPEPQFRMERLMVHDGEISTGIQQEGNREQSLLVSAFLAAKEVGGHPDKPVERQ